MFWVVGFYDFCLSSFYLKTVDALKICPLLMLNHLIYPLTEMNK